MIPEILTETRAYSQVLKNFLVSKGIWHRFIEFDEPVKTVEQAARKVPAVKIAKSIVLIDSNQEPLLAILLAKDKISYRKVKEILRVRDVRLANNDEVLDFSGYPVGGVPPFNNIKRSFLDLQVLDHQMVIAGGGDINMLVELKTKDILDVLKPVVEVLTRE
jgi:prolyl-tRNA editing enzyme YbaK/EbsC (Cys-tRNA(Pro) deacylase)